MRFECVHSFGAIVIIHLLLFYRHVSFFSLWPHTVTEQVCKLVRCILFVYFPYSHAFGYYHFTDSLYTLPLLQHLGILILLVAGIFMGAILIDKIRIYLSDVVYNFICSFYMHLPYRWADAGILEILDMKTFNKSKIK